MMTRKLVTVRIALILGLSTAALACADDEGQDDASDAEETDGTEGDGDGDAGDGDGAPGDGDGAPGDGDGAPGDGDGAPGDGDGDGTPGDGDGAPEPDLVEQACAANCELITACWLEVPGCVEACVESHAEAGECFDEQLAVVLCINDLTCEEFEAALEGLPGAACQDELAAGDACGGE